jgi:hypothetical protein
MTAWSVGWHGAAVSTMCNVRQGARDGEHDNAWNSDAGCWCMSSTSEWLWHVFKKSTEY